MEKIKFESIPFYCYAVETNLLELGAYVRTKAQELYQTAVKEQLEITGPVYWVYYGMDGNPTTTFKLEIGLPVNKCKQLDGSLLCKELSAGNFLVHTLRGAWSLLPETYAMLFAELAKQGLSHNGICREAYLYIDFNNPDNNITEIQVGFTY